MIFCELFVVWVSLLVQFDVRESPVSEPDKRELFNGLCACTGQ